MSRPKPNVIMEYTEPTSYNTEQVLSSDAVYAVVFDYKPINIRIVNKVFDDNGPKYKKVSFVNPGYAFNLRDRLNKKFRTNKFQVMRYTKGEIIKKENE